MYVIEGKGHLGFYWDGESTIFIEHDSGIFPSRSSCLEYLQQFHSKEKAVEIIMEIKKHGKTIISF